MVPASVGAAESAPALPSSFDESASFDSSLLTSLPAPVSYAVLLPAPPLSLLPTVPWSCPLVRSWYVTFVVVVAVRVVLAVLAMHDESLLRHAHLDDVWHS